MINFGAIEQLRKGYKDLPFLNEQRINAQKNKPYEGLRIVHNIPLTVEAVLKIEPLLLGGADVTMSCPSMFYPQQAALNVLRDAHVKVQLEPNFTGPYDFCMDCCGELINIVTPRIGAAELTQTGSEKYKKAAIDYPVISIDDSDLKLLETVFGTSAGFINAILKYFPEGINNRKFIVFGYGKVGMGIVSALLKFTDNIVVIDIDDAKLQDAMKKGVHAIHGADKKEVVKSLENADLAVTATGVEGLISNEYGLSEHDFSGMLLANMGVDDEYGENFAEESVLFNKKTLNFMLEEPTPVRYLDPVLYAHNLALDLILINPFKNGYHRLPPEIADSILDKWCELYGEKRPSRTS